MGVGTPDMASLLRTDRKGAPNGASNVQGARRRDTVKKCAGGNQRKLER